MISAHSRELPPMHRAWSSCVHGRSCASGERDPDVVPPRLAVHEHAVHVEQDGVEAGSGGLHEGQRSSRPPRDPGPVGTGLRGLRVASGT